MLRLVLIRVFAIGCSIGLWIGVGNAAETGDFRTKVVGQREEELPPERAHSTVSRMDLDRRQPRSAPDALRFEPGVFVQQTAHGQGSAYLRGLTGQQTVLLFDGIRISNSTFRQGPNQYFFTIDSQTLSAIEILRGGASTRYGSDALGGVIAAFPIEPFIVDKGTRFLPRLIGRFTTADKEKGGRTDLMGSVALSKGRALSFIVGVGGRDVDRLESGGRLENPTQHPALPRFPDVPRYARDGRTQLGTGFREITADGRFVFNFGQARYPQRLTLASYHYLQFDVPRTDQCPPPAAQENVCQTYEEQHRHLSYLAYDYLGGGSVLRALRLSLSHQQQHEKQRLEDENIFVRFIALDDVDTLGFSLTANTFPLYESKGLRFSLAFGADSYLDFLSSGLTRIFTDTDRIPPKEFSRGQYISGSRYLTGGLFLDGELSVLRAGSRFLTVRAGGRYGVNHAYAPEDLASGSTKVNQGFFPFVGHLGAEIHPHRLLTLRINLDHSYRAPNLNDLTARQTTGPGFQFENASLRPERATTFELGAILDGSIVRAEAWAYQTLLSDIVLKVAQPLTACPKETPQCLGAWSRFQLQNGRGLAEIRGVEGVFRLALPKLFRGRGGLFGRATISYAFGEGPREGNLAQGAIGITLSDKVPLSRIPPLNGTVELWSEVGRALSLGVQLRWAAMQDRLAIADYSDGRIPRYGTPGFAVLDLRASYQVDRRVFLQAVLENVADSPYRYHGSSINGPGRGFVLSVRVQ